MATTTITPQHHQHQNDQEILGDDEPDKNKPGTFFPCSLFALLNNYCLLDYIYKERNQEDKRVRGDFVPGMFISLSESSVLAVLLDCDCICSVIVCNVCTLIIAGD